MYAVGSSARRGQLHPQMQQQQLQLLLQVDKGLGWLVWKGYQPFKAAALQSSC
jgi:hypothetical protein